MANKARLLRIDNQPLLIQLIISFLVVIVAGTLIFYFLIYSGSLLFGKTVEDIMSVPEAVPGVGEMFYVRYVQICQQVALFLLPSIIIMYMIKDDKESFFGLNRFPKPLTILLVLILSLSIIPITTYTGILNSKMVLPEMISGIEDWMKAKEETASHLTNLLIASSGFIPLAVNIFILAVVPAFSEEMLFRGVFQRLLSGFLRSDHAGILVTAALFSTIHFQFYGFIPRLILGLGFGYLFYLTRSLWSAIIAHFVNNVIPVLVAFYTGGNLINEQLFNKGSDELRIPFIPVIIVCIVFYFLQSEYRKRKMEMNS